jgi:preprotein translocase subunit SecD
MLKFSKWKLVSIVIVILLSIYFSIPTFFYNVKETSFFTNQKVNFGLDLRGGVSLTIQASLDDYVKEKFLLTAEQLRSKLNSNNIHFDDWDLKESYLKFSIKINQHKNALKEVKNLLKNKDFVLENSGDNFIIKFNNDYVERLTSEVLKQSIEIIRKRVDSVGTKEVEIQTFGKDMILLQVPGLSDPKEIKKIIGKTARLSFHMVKNKLTDNITEAEKIALLINSKVVSLENDKGALIVESRPVMTGDMLEFASVDKGRLGESVIKFRFDSLGRDIFADVTTKNNGKMLAIIFDDKIISHPVINEPILGGEGIISGNMTPEAATDIALLLRAGSLPVPLQIIEERLVGPTLGMESIKAGIKACIIAAVLVFIIMLGYYRFFGLIACAALIINFIMMISVLSIFGATLTLPGIAGIVLTLGMAVDANVLIFERIKEELKKGMVPLNALHNGYKYAFITIFDSNTTTIFVAIVLYIFGTGPTKGFAITLIIGILCSMFTSVSITKAIITLWYRAKNPKIINL